VWGDRRLRQEDKLIRGGKKVWGKKGPAGEEVAGGGAGGGRENSTVQTTFLHIGEKPDEKGFRSVFLGERRGSQ